MCLCAAVDLCWWRLHVLAECEAKRRIVDMYLNLGGGLVDQPLATAFNVACMLLAGVYADHPDYDESWRP